MRKTYQAQKQPDNTFLVPAVEIFQLGESKGFNYTPEWFQKACENHRKFADNGYLPAVIIGHTGLSDKEKSVIAEFDNLRLAEDGKTVLVDYLIESDGAFVLFNKFPHRSVEVFAEAAHFSRIAHLGGTEPYFKLPPLRVEQFSAREEEPQVVEFATEEEPDNFELDPETPLAEIVQTQKLNRELSDLDWAFWDKLWAIRDSEMSIDEKKAAMIAACEEWAGLATAAIEKIGEFSLETAPESFRTQYSAMQEELKSFRREKLEQQKQLIVAQFDTLLATTPIARPILQSFLALRTSLISETPLDLCVEFSENGQPKSVPFAAALDTLLKQIISAAESNTLMAKTTEHKVPFSQNPASLHDSVTEQALPKNFSADQKIKQVLKDRGIKKFNHTQYAAVRDELIAAGEITIE